MEDYTILLVLREIELIIKYKFKTRSLLFDALQSSSTPPPGDENQPSLALGGQRALEAIGWQIFWAGKDAKDVTLSDLDRGVIVRRELDEDANLLRVVNQSGLNTFIGTKEIDVVSSRFRAILGAVWLDSEKHLEQVKDVMRILKLLPEQEVEGAITPRAEDLTRPLPKGLQPFGLGDPTLPMFEDLTNPDA